MDVKTSAKEGVYFVWNVLILMISLFIWRFAFNLITLIILIALAIPFGIAFGASTAIGLPSDVAIIFSLVIGFILTAAVGSLAARYGYECPQLDVSFTSPE
jgi:hypothetical protein